MADPMTGVAADEHTILFTRDGLPGAHLPTDALASVAEARDLVVFAEARIAAAHGHADARDAS